MGVALVGTAPLDYLSHRLQHMDYKRGSMRELLDNSAEGLVACVHRWYWELAAPLYESESSGDFSAVEWWTGQCIADVRRSTCVGLDAAVWCRLELKYPVNKREWFRSP